MAGGEFIFSITHRGLVCTTGPHHFFSVCKNGELHPATCSLSILADFSMVSTRRSRDSGLLFGYHAM